MPVKIAICDDSPEDVLQLKKALLVFDPMFEIITFSDGNWLMDELLEGQFSADILFLDIYMPELSGIEVARRIRSFLKDIKIIFLTSSEEYYPQAYEVFAFNYIVKPFDRDRLYTVLSRALEELLRENTYKICIQYKGIVHNVDCRKIQYIESQDKLILFHLEDQRILQCYGKLEEILKELPEKYFLRCHQSFIVNLTQVTEAGEQYFRIGQTMISISRKYSKEAKERYFCCLFSQLDGGQAI